MAFTRWMLRHPRASALRWAALVSSLFCAAAPAEPPAAPYWSVQLASVADRQAALGELKALDAPDARAEQRDGYYLVRVGATATMREANKLLAALAAKGVRDARVVKVTRSVEWLRADSGTLTSVSGASSDAAPLAPAASPAPVAATPTSSPDSSSAAPAGGEASADAPRPAADPATREPISGVALSADAVAAEAIPAVLRPAVPATRYGKGLVEAPAVHVPDAGGATDWGTTLVSLEQLGNADGLMLEGDRGIRELFFPMPAGVPVQKAAIVLDVEFGDLVIAPSTIQFRVNGTVRRAIRRGDGGLAQRVEIPLNAHDLSLDFAKVEADYTLLLSQDVCFSRHLAGAYARIAPESGLSVVSSDPLPRTVRAAWSLLPREVVIAAHLSGVSPAEFQALFSLATLLHREGHLVRYEEWRDGAPTGAHIVLAPAARYARAGDALEARANLRIVRSGGGRHGERAFILIDSARPLPAADMLRMPSRGPSGAGLVDVAATGNWPLPRERGEAVRLSRLGFADSERAFTLSAQWGIGLPFGPLGEGQRPSHASLELYAPKLSDIRAPTIVSAYYNDRLVYSTALRGDGGKEVLDFDLPRVQLRARNNLRVVAQRDGDLDDCQHFHAAYPLSISPDSVIQTRPINETPATFADLVPYQQSLEVYVARDALSAPDHVIPALVALGDHFWPDVPPPALRIFEPGAEVSPEGPFLVVGDAAWRPRAYVAFDKGRVQVRSNATGEPLTLLDFASDASPAVLQMVQVGSRGGAWLKAFDGYGRLGDARIQLEDEQVALLGPRGVSLSLRIGPTRDYRVDYPDSKGWFEATGSWRTVVFASGWIIVVSLLLYLYLKSRRHGG